MSDSANLWSHGSYAVQETSTGVGIRMRFLANLKGEGLTAYKRITARMSILDVADCVAAACSGVLRGTYKDLLICEGNVGDHPVMVEITTDRNSSVYDDDESLDEVKNERRSLFPQQVMSVLVEVTGHRDAITAIHAALDAGFGKHHIAQIHWWYNGGSRGPSLKKIYLPPVTTQLHPEYYPDIEGGPQSFISEYLNSEESILLMAGPPGTGKTTLLRHMIVEHKLVAHVCYDEALMASDAVFQTFLMDRESDLLIIEDADVVLTSRERDNNHLMARFLNVSDGLIKLPNKKLIFTSNATDFNKIDHALLRPGRCFAVLHTRPLTLKEAQDAAKVGGFPTPTERKEYTIAQLFNQGKAEMKIRRIGMTG